MTTTQDIRIARLEGKVQTLEDVQTAMLNKLDVLIANQDELKANQDELKANQDKLKANQDKLKANQDKLIANQNELRASQDSIIDMIKMIIQELADIKDKVSG